MESEHKRERRIPDAAFWGALPKGGAQRFSLNQAMPGGGSRKVGMQAENGVMRYDWPISVLSVDWVRENFGTGRFRANWIAVDERGAFVPRGGSRVVDIVGTVARARGARRTNGAAPASVFYREHATDSPAPPAAPMPPDVADMRVRAAEEIATARIKAQQEIFRDQLEWQRQQSEERYERLEERMTSRLEDLERRRGRDDDDDDEPSEWAWLRDLVMPLAPMIQAAAPELLKRFVGKGLPQ